MLDSRRVSATALLLLPSGLLVYFAFNAGGYYPGPPAYVAVLLAVVLVVRITGALRPLEGIGTLMAAAAALFAFFTLWTLVSQHWSHSPGGALVDFDRCVVYLLAMVLFGAVRHRRFHLTWVLRLLAVGILVVCGSGLITRLLPHLWPTSPDLANNRLSFPVTYWNVLGLLAALGVVLSVHFACDDREPILCRVLGAAAAPILATTLYFTLSRGSIGVCIVALVAYVVLGRPRTMISATIALLPAVLIAVKVAYDASQLVTPTPTTPPAVTQGHHVAVVLLGCVIGAAIIRGALVALLDHRLTNFRLPAQRRRAVTRTAWGVLALACVIALVALQGTISRDYHAFLNSGATPTGADIRARLTDLGNNGRLPLWRVAWHEFKAAPIIGQGAGTFVNSNAEHGTYFVQDAHSLYLQTLDELGLVGFIPLLGVILLILIRAVTRIRGPDRAMYAAAFALLLAWSLENAVDWDWQMPVVTILFFILGGVTLARGSQTAVDTDDAAEAAPRGWLVAPIRTALGVACVLLAVTPAYVWLSQRKLNQADSAFAAGDYRSATDDALSSIAILGDRPEPYEVVAYCDVHRDLPGMAIQAIQRALSLDPQNWNYAYGLALMRAAAGLNPLPAARLALRLDPQEPLVQEAWAAFSTDTPAQWQSDGLTAAQAFTSL